MSDFAENRTLWNQTTNTITIRASQSPLTDGYNLNRYSLNGTNPPGGGFNGWVNVDQDMEISGLNSGSVYSLWVNGHAQLQNCNLKSLTSTVVDNVCTGTNSLFSCFCANLCAENKKHPTFFYYKTSYYVPKAVQRAKCSYTSRKNDLFEFSFTNKTKFELFPMVFEQQPALESQSIGVYKNIEIKFYFILD